MNQVQAKRLLNVAKALRESAVPRLFTMAHWGYGADEVTSPQADKGCGTPACALGHYASRRDLQRAFKLDEDGLVNDASDYSVGFDVEKRSPEIEEHFGLSRSEPSELFGPEGCGHAKTVKEAARYIERFVKRKQREQSKKGGAR